MSCSRRKHPFCGITLTDTEKQDKRTYNRRYRRALHMAVAAAPAGDDFPLLREYSDPWAMGKDGKMRFDPTRHPKLMRK